MLKKFYVYILTNYNNKVLYTGITSNLQRRIYQHKTGMSTISFTNKYNINKLIWFQEFTNPEEAIMVEKKIKGWRREKKINLIKKLNIDFKDLLK